MAIQALTQMAETILDVVDWGIGIATALLIWELLAAVFNSSKKGVEASGIMEIERNPVLKWLGLSKEGKRLKRTKAVNAYLAKEVEEKKLENCVSEVEIQIDRLEKWDTNKEIPSHTDLVGLRNKSDHAQEAIISARKYFKVVKRDQWRLNTGLDKMLKDMEGKDANVTEIKALENNIMKLHKETSDEVKKAEAHFKTILQSDAWKAVMKLKKPSFGKADKFKINPPGGRASATRFNQTHLAALITGFGNDLLMLKKAFAKQTKAKQEMQGLMAQTREFYK
jgi:hypothetical protein